MQRPAILPQMEGAIMDILANIGIGMIFDEADYIQISHNDNGEKFVEPTNPTRNRSLSFGRGRRGGIARHLQQQTLVMICISVSLFMITSFFAAASFFKHIGEVEFP
jgi:hypothetical protein